MRDLLGFVGCGVCFWEEVGELVGFDVGCGVVVELLVGLGETVVGV